jgi:translation initiation factor IF-2
MDTKDTTDKTARPGAAGTTGSGTAGAGTRKPLSLQRTVESGHVRQNFSHGRSKPVIVEKRKSRKLGGADAPAPAAPAPVSVKPVSAPESTAPQQRAPERSDATRSLRPEERDARARALAEARRQNEIEEAESVERRRVEAASKPAEAPAPAPVAAAPAAAPVAAAPTAPAPTPAPAAPAPVQARAPSSAPRRDGPPPRSEQGARPAGRFEGRGGPRPAGQGYNTAFMPREGGRPKEINIPSSRPPPAPDRPAIEPPKGKEVRTEARARPEMVEDEETRVIKRGGKIVRTPVKTTPEPQKERVKLTINNAFDQEQRERSLASLKRKRERERLKAMGVQQPRDKIVREVIIPEAITIQELSNRMAERAVDLIKLMMKQGAMHKITDVIDADTA